MLESVGLSVRVDDHFDDIGVCVTASCFHVSTEICCKFH
jgi:hypothetical protein